jgi:hypothetical protein
MYLAIALVVTGLYNASVNKPGLLTTSRARTTYRVVAYVGKIGLVALASPLLDRVVTDTVLAAQIRLGVVTGGYVLGAFLRFFRNDNLPPRVTVKAE